MESIISDSYDVTTLLGSSLGLASLLPVTFDYNKNFTLNKYLNVAANVDVDYTDTKLRYFGVGIRGCYNTTDEVLVSPYHPARTNMNLYSLVPIRCVPIDEDLDASTRSLYRMRVVRNIGDTTYVLYYLKLLTFDSTIKYKRVSPITGDEEVYELEDSDLSPTPVKPTTDSALASTDSNVIAYCDASLSLEADEILEYIRANFNGDTRYARISELGFFTGVDMTVQTKDYQENTFNYTEAINVHLYNHSTWIGTPLTHSGMKIESTFQILSSGAILSK